MIHDWGSALGFDWARRHPERVAGIVYMEAMLREPRSEFLPRARQFFRGLRSPQGEKQILKGNIFIENVVRGQWGPDERNAIMLSTAESDAEFTGNTCFQIFEQEPGSDGRSVAVQLIRLLARFPVMADKVTGGMRWRVKDRQKVPGEAKVVRARPLAAQAEAGNVHIVKGRWNKPFL